MEKPYGFTPTVMPMIKIHDCSNSAERPAHRGGGGPVMNDIMRHLHDLADAFDAEFTAEPSEADVILTNDVFPESVRNLGKPMVKRMCGPFCQRELLCRNEPLNESAKLADGVIFISKYSRDQYLHIYSNPDGSAGLKKWTVVKNWVEPLIYHDYAESMDYDYKADTFTLAATATDWGRMEKRFVDLMEFAGMFPDVDIMLIGKCNADVPKNVIKLGYKVNPLVIANFLNTAHGFINLSYRDAAPKVVAQAVSCGLPVLYADSGGTGEMAGEFGVGIPDDKSLGISDCIPRLNPEAMARAFEEYRRRFDEMKIKLAGFDREDAFWDMAAGYFGAMESCR